MENEQRASKHLPTKEDLRNLVIAAVGGILAIWIEAAFRQIIPTWLSPAILLGIVGALGLGTLWIIHLQRLEPSRRKSFKSLFLFGILPFFAFLVGILINQELQPPIHPVITITSIPPIGSGTDRMEEIGGEVSGIGAPSAYTNYFVAIYSYAENSPGKAPWFVQPTSDKPLTPIGSDGKWTNRIYLGSKYAAILVEKTFRPFSTLHSLPTISEKVLAITEVEGSSE